MLQQLPATRLFFASLLQSPRCELFSPAASKPPSHKRRRGKGPATSQHDRGLLALVHPPSSRAPSPPSPLPSPTPGGKHKLDITAREKVIFILWQALSVQSYFRRMLSSVATHNISSFIQEEQAGNHIYKEVFLPRWVGSDLSDVPLGSIKRRPECNYSHGKTEHERIVRTIGRPFVVNVGHSAAESGKHARLPARMGTLWWNIILQQHIQIDFGQWV